MVDFTSALYLGFRHGSRELRPWPQFTTGRPAVLGTPGIARRVARGLAELQGCESATLATSTLHVFWDLCAAIAGRQPAIFLDQGTYPVARWGVERAAARGAPVRVFRHHDPCSLQRALAAGIAGRRPVIVADGFCPACGQCAPVAAYLALAREYQGYLVLDDTQALGIFGHSPGPEAPYGKGGGGMLRRAHIGGPEVVVVSSMAKAFGVPMAVLSGSGEIVERYEAHSETRMHCSPPSIASLHAAENALRLNREEGDTVRWQLVQLVRFFRDRMRQIGLALAGGLFPVQSLSCAPGLDLRLLYIKLHEDNIHAVLHRSCEAERPRLTFLVTAQHTVTQLQRAVKQVHQIARPDAANSNLEVNNAVSQMQGRYATFARSRLRSGVR